ncbi:dephospho-CoA kinase [Polaribacter sp. BAL334]|uniref:dephospho-CoA kinase n=1 Tax=Polaribacter sp. BAL334 TaxID=1708178 RepID=UPI0018D211FC|nr:dephospho-CoA kinase [Polaribacter sp. BAL334]MBG7612989.1 dephospho-CoA kinase [Polaribacter sp. BAL334]
MVVGLTGGIGSGKSTVAKLFAAYKNTAIYTADEEAKKLMNSSKIIAEKVIVEFGNETYKNGELQRDFLAKIVFQNPEKLAILNSIVHPEVRNHFQNFIHTNQDKLLIIYENAILFESKSNVLCDVIITVFASLSTRIERVMERDHCSKEAVLNRIQNQLSEESKMIQSHYIIINDTLENTKNQVKYIHNILTEKR